MQLRRTPHHDERPRYMRTDSTLRSASAIWPTFPRAAYPSFEQCPGECEGGCGQAGDERQCQQTCSPVLALDLPALAILDVRVQPRPSSLVATGGQLGAPLNSCGDRSWPRKRVWRNWHLGLTRASWLQTRREVRTSIRRGGRWCLPPGTLSRLLTAWLQSEVAAIFRPRADPDRSTVAALRPDLAGPRGVTPRLHHPEAAAVRWRIVGGDTASQPAGFMSHAMRAQEAEQTAEVLVAALAIATDDRTVNPHAGRLSKCKQSPHCLVTCTDRDAGALRNGLSSLGRIKAALVEGSLSDLPTVVHS